MNKIFSEAMKVAIQGAQNSFHDIARRAYFSNSEAVVHCDTFKQVFQAVEKDNADMGLVAIENSLYGSINDVYDLLLKYRFWISGEIYLRINHCLLGVNGATLATIKEVHSQLPALAQCEEFLDTKLSHAERLEHHDTAGSAADVAKWNDRTKAAIASRTAGELHNLKILAEDIETHKQNYTRFIIFSKQKKAVVDANKTSLVVRTDMDTKPGALYRTLGVFAKRNINLTKIESRPIIGKAWHYMFYLDFDQGIENTSTKDALHDLSKMKVEATPLGSYLKGQIIE